MGTYEITIHTACCDVEGCEKLYGDEEDWGWDWFEYSWDAEREAVQRGDWTKESVWEPIGQSGGGMWREMLVCDADDEDHSSARGVEFDNRPKPGPGQIAGF